ncbi:TIGR02285 family protein [Pseudomonas alliivorans]|nr:TIGR02285 family protein [Pseudomonas alliivorans]MEE4832229.1 TIGR02285 family protein [Pseudomonas alliivorans]MEE4923876.1 TIGR02285 family protein [Pseudomonas alliivorans]
MILRASHCAMIRLLLTLWWLAMPGTSQARETLTWLLRDLPPSTIFSGTMQGQGAIDQLMPLLTAGMPEYEHVVMHVNRARAMQTLNDGTILSCDPTMLWTPERARTIAFSIPAFVLYSSGLIVFKADMAKFEPFVSDGKVDLDALMASNTIKLGAVAERSYGGVIDKTLQDSHEQTLSLHYGSDAVGSLLQMARAGRLQGLLGFWFEARYQALQQGISPQELTFLPIAENPVYQLAYIGCSNTPEGRQAMQLINREMRTLRESSLMGLYAQWLAPEQRGDYLRDVKAIFEKH